MRMAWRGRGGWRWLAAALFIAALVLGLGFVLRASGLGTAANVAQLVSLAPLVVGLANWPRAGKTGAQGREADLLARLGEHLRTIAYAQGLTGRDVRERIAGWDGDRIDAYLDGKQRPGWDFVVAFLDAVAGDERWRRELLEQRLRPVWEAAGAAAADGQGAQAAGTRRPVREPGRDDWLEALREAASRRRAVEELRESVEVHEGLATGMGEVLGRLAQAAAALGIERDELRRQVADFQGSRQSASHPAQAELEELRGQLRDLQERLSHAERLKAQMAQRLEESERQRLLAEQLRDEAIARAERARLAAELDGSAQHALPLAATADSTVLMGGTDRQVTEAILGHVDRVLEEEAARLSRFGEIFTGSQTPDWRRRRVVAVAVAIVFAAAGLTGWLTHGPSAEVGGATPLPLAWTAAQAPLPRGATAGKDQFANLGGVVCSAPGSCVAVGIYETGTDGAVDKPLIETFSGGTWTASSAVAGAGVSGLLGVACPTRAYCVTVGYHATSPNHQIPVAVTLSDGIWTAASLPLPRNAAQFGQLEDVECLAPGACIATGFFNDQNGSQQALIETLAHGAWTALRAPLPAAAASAPDASLSETACPTVGWCIAIGSYTANNGNQESFIETLADGTWTPKAAPLPADADPDTDNDVLNGISCQAPRHCIAVGTYSTYSVVSEPEAETLSGGTWTAATPPIPADAVASLKAGDEYATLNTVACRAPDSCVALGSYTLGNGADGGLVDTLSGKTWTTVKAPLPPDAFGADPIPVFESATCATPNDCIAVGSYATQEGSRQAFIETASSKRPG